MRGRISELHVHAIVHLADEAKLHGVLDNVSCFVFENHLGKIKKLLRKPDAPLQQVVKRLSERTLKAVFTKDKILQKSHHDGPVPSVLCECRQFREFHQPAFTVSLNAKDSCVLVSRKPAVVRNFLQGTMTVLLHTKNSLMCSVSILAHFSQSD